MYGKQGSSEIRLAHHSSAQPLLLPLTGKNKVSPLNHWCSSFWYSHSYFMHSYALYLRSVNKKRYVKNQNIKHNSKLRSNCQTENSDGKESRWTKVIVSHITTKMTLQFFVWKCTYSNLHIVQNHFYFFSCCCRKETLKL